MSWADRLALFAEGESSNAKSAKSANRSNETGTCGPFGTNGTFGSRVESDREGGTKPPDPADQVLAHIAAIAPNIRDALGADDVLEDHAAVIAAAALPPPKPGPTQDADLEALIARWAEAQMRPRPWQTVTDQAKALDYFKRRGRAVLEPLDGTSRGLLVSSVEADARRFERKL